MNLAKFHAVTLEYHDTDWGVCIWKGNILIPDNIELTGKIIAEFIEQDKLNCKVDLYSRKYDCLIRELLNNNLEFMDQLRFLWVR